MYDQTQSLEVEHRIKKTNKTKAVATYRLSTGGLCLSELWNLFFETSGYHCVETHHAVAQLHQKMGYCYEIRQGQKGIEPSQVLW